MFTGLTSEESWFDSRQGQYIFLFFKMSRPTLRPADPLIQWAPGGGSFRGYRGRGV